METNGNGHQNGHVNDTAPTKRPRTEDSEDVQVAKKAKVAKESADDEVIVLDDADSGAIVILDD